MRKSKKPLDKLERVWYNVSTVRGTEKPKGSPKKISKSFEKPLDKPPKVWYNISTVKERSAVHHKGNRTLKIEYGKVGERMSANIPPIPKQPPRAPSKKDHIRALLDRVNGWLAEGDTIDEALGKLTPKQYDFLIDNDVDFDNLMFTPEQLQAISEVKKAKRTCKPGGYNKVYPQSKQDLYNGIVAYVQSQGAEIIPREKTNFRDLDFTIDGTRYKIVLSNPRK